MKLVKLIFLFIPLYFFSAASFADTKIYSINELNTMSTDNYDQALTGIIQNTNWPIQGSAAHRPFKGFIDMYFSIINVIEQSGKEKQLELIKAHPVLACKNKREDNIAASSQGEQSGAGLNECTVAESDKLEALNKAYSEKFGYAFLLAVKNATKQQIFSSLESRLNNSQEEEFQIALQQEYKIILFRLLDRVQ